MLESGFLNIFKPPGMTSHDVVYQVRQRLGIKKVGHAGTLDPLACGVLVCLVNSATRRMNDFSHLPKTYRAEALFGVKTDSGDADGKVIERCDAAVTESAVLSVFHHFRGEIEQVPPMVSALKKDGVPLYRLQRQGITIDRPPRRVTIFDIELVGFRTDGSGRPRALIEITCSGGTYIRTLVEDIGAAIGVPAVTAFLVRTAIGPFHIEDSLDIDAINHANALEAFSKNPVI